MKNHITINEIAQKAGVSKTTISNYLNGKYSSMSDEVKNEIERIVTATGYKPNDKRRNFHNNKNLKKTIGFIVPDITDSFYAFIAKGITSTCFNYGYSVVLANSDNNLLREKDYIESLSDKVDGFIVSTVGTNNEFLASLSGKTEIVLVDRSIPNSPYDLISSNNKEAVSELLDYLIALGYKSFAAFSEQLHPEMARTKRVSAYMNYFSAKYPYYEHSTHIVNIHDDKTMMKELVNLAPRLSKQKTVFFATNGRTLLQLIAAAQSLGINDKADIGICGYDDFEWADKIKEGITTISQPTIEIGESAVERLINRIEFKKNLPPEEILLKSKIEIRRSL